MQIIITNLSRLKPQAGESGYASDLGEICGTNTNDAPVTYLLRCCQAAAEPVRIIAVTTPEAETAYDAFSGMLGSVSKQYGFLRPALEKVCAVQPAETIRKIVALIPPDASVFIDTTGGFRNSSYVLMAVARILEFSGIHLQMAVYSRFDGVRCIEDVTSNYRLFDLISAANSFTEFGNSHELSAFFADHDAPEIRNVLQAMNAFSEAVALCRTTGLEAVLGELNRHLNDLDKMQTAREDEILFQSLSGTIREKFGIFSDGKGKVVDYPAVIRWCLEHQLIQQAVTIYTEKIPSYLLRQKYLTADAKTVNQFYTAHSVYDPDYKLFYEGFLMMSELPYANTLEISSYFSRIKENKTIRQELAESASAEEFLEKKPKHRKNLGPKGVHALERLLLLIRSTFGEGTERLESEEIARNLAEYPDLLEIAETTLGENPLKFLNSIINKKKWHQILSEAESVPVRLIEKPFRNARLNTIETLADLTDVHTCYTVQIPIRQMQDILRDYLYIKNYLRNLFNHASEENDRSKEETAYLKAHGYPTGEKPSLQEIISVMQRAVVHCQAPAEELRPSGSETAIDY